MPAVCRAGGGQGDLSRSDPQFIGRAKARYVTGSFTIRRGDGAIDHGSIATFGYTADAALLYVRGGFAWANNKFLITHLSQQGRKSVGP